MRLAHRASPALVLGAALLSLALSAPAVALAAPAPGGPRAPIGNPRPIGHTTVASNNWAGYAASGGNGAFNSVAATWAQPSVTCSAGETAYASFWVGLDGDNSRSVEQIGTDSDCQNGTPTYYAWYEMYPKLSGRVPLAVGAGDTVAASVTATPSGSFTLSISVNGGTPQTVTASNPRAARSSAEVIVEAPSSNHGPHGTLGLADFGSVGFSGADVNGTALGSSNPNEIVMETASGTVKAQPSGLKGADAFSVTWEHR